MYCIECGTRLPDGARFCYKCGSVVFSPEEPAAEKTAVTETPEAQSTAEAVPLDLRSLPKSAVLESATDSHEPEPSEAPSRGSYPAEENMPEEAVLTSAAEPDGKQSESPAAPPEEPEVLGKEETAAVSGGDQSAPADPIEEEPDTSGVPTESPSKADDSSQSEESPAEQVPSSSADGKGKKGAKNIKNLLLVLFTVIVLGACAYYFLVIYPAMEFQRYFDSGKAAMEALDYEKASGYLSKAYEIRSDDPDLNTMLYSAYDGLCDEYLAEGSLEKAVETRKAMFGILEDRDDEIRLSLGLIGRRYIRGLLLDGRSEKARAAAQELSPLVNSDDSAEFDKLIASYSSLQDFADQIAALSDGGEDKRICTLIGDRKSEIIYCSDTEDRRQPVFQVDGADHEYVVFYRHSSGQYYVYYGDLDDSGKRNGSGAIYYDGRSTSRDNLYYYRSGWESDRPNGPFEEHEFTGTDHSSEVIYEGSLSDGYFDGRIKITWSSGQVYYGEYQRGKITVYGIDDSTGRFIVAYTEAKDDWLSYGNDPSSSLFGVDFY